MFCRDQDYPLWNVLWRSGLSSLCRDVRMWRSGFSSLDLQRSGLSSRLFCEIRIILSHVLQRSGLSSLECSVEIRIILSRMFCRDQDCPLSNVLQRSVLSSLEISVEIRIILSGMFCRDQDYPLSNDLWRSGILPGLFCRDQDYPLSNVLQRSGLSSLECSVEIRIILSRLFCRIRIILSGMFCRYQDYPLECCRMFCKDQDYPLWIVLQRSGLSSLECCVKIRIILSGFRIILSEEIRDCSVEIRIILSRMFCKDQDFPLWNVL